MFEEYVASIFRLFILEDGDSTFLQNIYELLLECMVS
jgi:hypothetical protein